MPYVDQHSLLHHASHDRLAVFGQSHLVLSHVDEPRLGAAIRTRQGHRFLFDEDALLGIVGEPVPVSGTESPAPDRQRGYLVEVPGVSTQLPYLKGVGEILVGPRVVGDALGVQVETI